MAWTYNDDEINGLIDSNIKDSPPNPPAVNTAETVRALLKAFWVAIRTQVANMLDVVEQSNSVTVNTYEEAVSHFAGDYPRTIYVKADSAYNDGKKSHYTYHPVLGVAFLGLDYNYNS